MWLNTFEERLPDWHALRAQTQQLELESALLAINNWWQQTPWQPYYLHWDDQSMWPSPWDLLADNVYCELARALGIVYTLLLVDHKDIDSLELVSTEDSNLVLVNKGKYILNWAPDQLLNIKSANIIIKKQINCEQLRYKLG